MQWGGNKVLAGKAFSFHNPAPSVLGMRRQVVEERLEQKKEDRLTVEPEKDAAARDKNIIELGEITVTGSLSETSIREFLKKQTRLYGQTRNSTVQIYYWDHEEKAG